jgi:hypothetical protein
MSALKSHKSSDQKIPSVRELIALHKSRMGYKNVELASLLNYSAPNVISMLESGMMKLPMNKVALTAQVLQIDPLYLAMRVDAENGFSLTSILEAVSKRTPVTLNEEVLIRALRAAVNGRDVNLSQHPNALEAMCELYVSATGDDAIEEEALLRILRKTKRSALAKGDELEKAKRVEKQVVQGEQETKDP